MACRERRRKYDRLKLYGEDGVARLAAQGGKCLICDRSIHIEDRRTHIDHCTECGSVRAVLCEPCNKIEGWAAQHDDPTRVLETMAEYIVTHREACPTHPALAVSRT